jgi:hypothetical protein
MFVGSVVNISILLVDRFNIMYNEEKEKAGGKKIDILVLKECSGSNY